MEHQTRTTLLDIWDDGDTVWILNEYYHDNNKKGQKVIYPLPSIELTISISLLIYN